MTGATGYLGGALIPRLLARGHRVLSLARRGSEGRIPKGSEAVAGDALDAETYRARVPKGATFVHLVGVAHPAPAMKVYWDARAEGESLLLATGLPATILRPWYVLGPGHRWPYFLLPLYAIAKLVPATREGALRLGLVTRAQMTAALVEAVENPPDGVRIVTVPEIRAAPPL